jgi:transcriptional regulator with AAA-type ATPase domain
MARVLLTFTGFHDPYARGLVGEEDQPGPILTVARELSFERIVLISTPAATRNTAETENALRRSSHQTEVEIVNLELLDPTDYESIFSALDSALGQTKYTDDDVFVSVASGTPQMHVTWLSLVASGRLRARILNTRPPRFVTKERPLVTEIDLFPRELGEHAIRVRPAEFAEERMAAAPVPSAPPIAEPEFLPTARLLNIVGSHPSLLQVLQKAALLAPTRFPVLVLGETGTGKELMARFIHHLSGRPTDRFIPLNCAAIPKDLVESTLFGHRKGSFTGAHDDRKGKFDAADGGTLFLDELGELPIEMQPKLLRVLQDGFVEPVGAVKGHRVDVRVVAATNIDVERAVESGQLRPDLFYRLKVGICRLPPLRERRSDIQRIALHVLDRVNQSLRRPKRFTPAALAWLQQRPWHGNVRDLENTVEGAAILTAGPLIDVAELQMSDGSIAPQGSGLAVPEPFDGFCMPDFIKGIRRRLIERALEIAAGNQSRAARLLGISSQALSKQLISAD